ncbi:phosphatase PAP2 family protein [Halopiger xanaduensis]|uniref:Phosphoesterase PA-phosphatase related protein n=1 Tax=Halopiger xanaduensis (strain DSM 18323 / JCM 14033 / SH-6) TaxID=797210 RepID=F8D5M7_HALXS|nr:phosphatase PAP2 family protein [Halopiger xanaduensis]AEH38868.1 phosphoesterase PA-phosphatase related protein [Halopiger xanaduensis SH-6]
MRAIGFETIRSALPEAAIEALGVATHLGDYSVVVLVGMIGVAVLEEEGDRVPFAVVVFGGIGLATVAKIVFGLPRPPGAGIGGYGFPSGHALGSTVVYGLLAHRIGTRHAVIGAAVVVAIVATSRIAIGVHYPTDVLAGVGMGAAYLVLALSALEEWPQPEREVSNDRLATDGGSER